MSERPWQERWSDTVDGWSDSAQPYAYRFGRIMGFVVILGVPLALIALLLYWVL